MATPSTDCRVSYRRVGEMWDWIGSLIVLTLASLSMQVRG